MSYQDMNKKIAWKPGTKPKEKNYNNRTTIRQILTQYLASGELITEVFTQSTQITSEPDLTDVKVKSIGGDYVEFVQAGSFGGRRFYVRLSDIISIEP